MKNSVIIFTVVCLSMALTVQASNYATQPLENSIILPVDVVDNMSILSIKAAIEANTRGYYMTGSFTVLKTPTGREGDVAKAVDISFRNTNILSSGASNNYIQANAQATRNDNNSINELRIYVHHDSSGRGNVDERNIKINWKTGSIEVVDRLSNVTVIYQENSILIIGTMQKDGYTVGVSLAISKQTSIG